MSKVTYAYNIIAVMFIILIIATLLFLWFLLSLRPSNYIILYGVIILIVVFLVLILMIMFEGDFIK